MKSSIKKINRITVFGYLIILQLCGHIHDAHADMIVERIDHLNTPVVDSCDWEWVNAYQTQIVILEF